MSLLNSTPGLPLHALQTQLSEACHPYPVRISRTQRVRLSVENQTISYQVSGVAEQLRASHSDSHSNLPVLLMTKHAFRSTSQIRIFSTEVSSNLMISHLTHRCHLRYHGHRIHPRPPTNHLGPRNSLQCNPFP